MFEKVKYFGFDEGNIRLPQKIEAIGPFGPGIETTYKMQNVWYKRGESWYVSNFTVKTAGGSQAVAQMVVASVISSRAYEHQKKDFFSISLNNGQATLSRATGKEERIDISKALLDIKRIYINDKNDTQIQRISKKIQDQSRCLSEIKERLKGYKDFEKVSFWQFWKMQEYHSPANTGKKQYIACIEQMKKTRHMLSKIDKLNTKPSQNKINILKKQVNKNYTAIAKIESEIPSLSK